MYRISSNKRPRHLFNSKDLGCGAYSSVALKEGGAYFKVRGIILMKFQNFIIFSFQITINNYHFER